MAARITGRTTLDALSRRVYGKTYGELAKLMREGYALPTRAECEDAGAATVRAALQQEVDKAKRAIARKRETLAKRAAKKATKKKASKRRKR